MYPPRSGSPAAWMHAVAPRIAAQKAQTRPAALVLRVISGAFPPCTRRFVSREVAARRLAETDPYYVKAPWACERAVSGCGGFVLCHKGDWPNWRLVVSGRLLCCLFSSLFGVGDQVKERRAPRWSETKHKKRPVARHSRLPLGDSCRKEAAMGRPRHSPE